MKSFSDEDSREDSPNSSRKIMKKRLPSAKDKMGLSLNEFAVEPSWHRHRWHRLESLAVEVVHRAARSLQKVRLIDKCLGNSENREHRANQHICAMIFPQQRKLMGSSAQKSSGVHWCRRSVRFKEVPEKVPGKVRGGFGTGFRRRFRRRSGRLWCRARSGSTEFWRRFRGGFGAEPGQVQQGSGEGSGEGLGDLVQSQVKFNRVPEKVSEKVWEALVQSQVRFNRVLEKVPGRLWCRARSSSTGFRRRFRRRSGRLGAEPGQVQQGSGEGFGEGVGGFGAEPG